MELELLAEVELIGARPALSAALGDVMPNGVVIGVEIVVPGFPLLIEVLTSPTRYE